MICPPIQDTSSMIEETIKEENCPFDQSLVTPTSSLSQEIIPSSSYSPATSYSCTQDAIESVQQDIISLRQAFPPSPKSSTSSNHQLVVSMGSEVRELIKKSCS